MTSQRFALLSIFLAIGLSAVATAHAEDPPAPVDRPPTTPTTQPTDARGWEREPDPRRVLVFPAIGRAVGTVASSIIWVAVAPFRGGLYLEDRYQISEHVRDVLYNDARTAGVIPTAAFASGFGLTFGAKAFHDDLFGDDESVSVSGKYGGAFTQAYQLKFELPSLLGSRVYVRSRARWEKKGNVLFQGIGNSAAVTSGTTIDPRMAEIETRFGERRILGLLSAGIVVGPKTAELQLGASLIHNDRDFSALDPSQPYTSIDEVYDTSAIVGYNDGFANTEVTADLEFDLVDRLRKTSRALRVRGFFGGAPTGDFNFVHYGSQVSVEQTLFRAERVLALRFAHEGVAGEQAEIPFTELPRLGGPGLLRGYKDDRFRDKLSAIATAEYRYPIHANIGGVLFLEAGKVAQDYDELTEVASDWHLGLGGGLFYRTPTGVKFRVDIAYGDALQVYFSTDVLDAFSSRLKEL